MLFAYSENYDQLLVIQLTHIRSVSRDLNFELPWGLKL